MNQETLTALKTKLSEVRAERLSLHTRLARAKGRARTLLLDKDATLHAEHARLAHQVTLRRLGITV